MSGLLCLYITVAVVSADALPHVIIYYIFLLLVVVAGSIILSVIWVTCYTRSKMHNGTGDIINYVEVVLHI